jgi:DNA-binding FadR family transcriptional regulator
VITTDTLTNDLHGKIVRNIGQKIISGLLQAGDLLPKEPELVKEYNASHSAIREAFRALVGKGLIESKKRVGTKVLPRESWRLLDPDVLAWQANEHMDDKLIRDILELRQLVEPAAARLAAQRATPSDINSMEKFKMAMIQCFKKGEIEEYIIADLNFHMSIFTASQNELIQRLGSVAEAFLRANIRLQQDPRNDSTNSLTMHEDVFQMIKAGNSDEAEISMMKIIQQAKKQTSVSRNIPFKNGLDH